MRSSCCARAGNCALPRGASHRLGFRRPEGPRIKSRLMAVDRPGSEGVSKRWASIRRQRVVILPAPPSAWACVKPDSTRDRTAREISQIDRDREFIRKGSIPHRSKMIRSHGNPRGDRNPTKSARRKREGKPASHKGPTLRSGRGREALGRAQQAGNPIIQASIPKTRSTLECSMARRLLGIRSNGMNPELLNFSFTARSPHRVRRRSEQDGQHEARRRIL